MRFPRYLARAADASGLVTARGWSDESAAAADAHARSRLARIEAWLRSDRREDLERYAYTADGVIVEEVLERFDLAGGGEAVVSRNGYGAEVLNEDRVMFVDVDVPAPPAPGAIARLFGRKASSHAALLDAKADELRAWQRAHPEVTVRAYRTHSGLRLAVLNEVFRPGEAREAELLGALGNDPLYRALCRRQRCYRARLTPKPWRVGMRGAPPATPLAEADRRAPELRAWLAAYSDACLGFAVCRMLETWGDAAVHPTVAQVLAFHDERTGCGSGLPLA